MKNLSFLIAALCVILCLSNCTKNNNTIVGTTPGNITGNVKIFDENGTALSDLSGAFISIKGTNYSTSSDANGKWTLANVEPGTFDFIFSKPGYDSLIIYGITFAGNGTLLLNPSYALSSTYIFNIDQFNTYSWPPDNIQYWPISKITDVKFTQPVIGNSFVPDSIKYLEIKMQCNNSCNYAIAFTSLQPGVSIYSFKNFLSLYSDFNSSTKIITLKYSSDNLTSEYKSGDKVYIRIYPGNGGYTQDLRNGEKHWVHLGDPAPEVSFIVP